MAIDLGTPPAAPPTSAPAATRTRTPGWRDPRLWVGVVVVAGSVLLGARVVGAADEQELAAWCRDRLAPPKRPKTWLVTDDLPRTLTGKVRRDLLAERTTT